HLLVAQCSHGFGVRGVARWTAQVPASDLRGMAGDGRLTVSVETADAAARYQGVVPLAAGGLAACLEAYFRDSEQLPTRISLAGGEFTLGRGPATAEAPRMAHQALTAHSRRRRSGRGLEPHRSPREHAHRGGTPRPAAAGSPASPVSRRRRASLRARAGVFPL